MSIPPHRQFVIQRRAGAALAGNFARWEAYLRRDDYLPLSRHPGWLRVLERGLGHSPYCLEAVEANEIVGLLPLALVQSALFGRFLVGLPYLNSGGVAANDEGVARALISSAVRLADDLEVRYLELRHERVFDHPAFNQCVSTKVHMRLALPGSGRAGGVNPLVMNPVHQDVDTPRSPTPVDTLHSPMPAAAEELWTAFPAKVRNQVRKAEQHGLLAAWGGLDLLDEFHDVFSRNMRDLGTPVYGKEFFRAILEEFPDRAEFCVVRAGPTAYAAGLLLHGWGVTEVPSASSLREFNFTNANMLLYWHLLQRAVSRGQAVFDFGRSTGDGNTYRFKKQWGAKPVPAEWQYYRRTGSVQAARPDNPSYAKLIRVWQRLPVPLTRWLGPAIVRGIP